MSDLSALRDMKPLKDYSDETWDRFFDFLYDGTENLTDEEVSQELKSAGIDVGPTVARLKKMIADRADRERNRRGSR